MASALVGTVCAVVGTYVVLRGVAFIGDAIAHAGFPGIVKVNAAIHNTEKRMKLYRVDPSTEKQLPGWSKGIASFNPRHHELSGTPPEHMIEHFGQQRKAVVDDCDRIKSNVDHYNASPAGRQLPFTLILDFAPDVAEREALRNAARGEEAA